ncbi:MAG TPA: GYD domain-containing protein [Bacteroidota bacterium]|jgi:uncharacterized protein with GYD domain
MAKFMIKASYTSEGMKGLMKEGGSSRKKVVEKMLAPLGGSVECFYYAFGDADVYSVVELPDAVSAAAVSFAINASGAVQTSMVPLLSPKEVDAACKKSVGYRAPGK